MTATDELRRLPDERGVEWFAPDGPRHDRRTEFGVIGGWDYCADESQWGYGIDLMAVRCVKTPEQAIASTLGSCNCSNSERTGTCRITDNGPWGYPYVCSECGASFDADVNNGEFNFCPNCGRRVEQ